MCFLIPLLTGLASALLGYLLGKSGSGKNYRAEYDAELEKNRKLTADLSASQKTTAVSTGTNEWEQKYHNLHNEHTSLQSKYTQLEQEHTTYKNTYNASSSAGAVVGSADAGTAVVSSISNAELIKDDQEGKITYQDNDDSYFDPKNNPMSYANASQLMSFDNLNYDEQMAMYANKNTLEKPESNFKTEFEEVKNVHPLLTSKYQVENPAPQTKLNYFDGNEYPHMFQNGFDTHFDKVAMPTENPLQVHSFDNRDYDAISDFYAHQKELPVHPETRVSVVSSPAIEGVANTQLVALQKDHEDLKAKYAQLEQKYQLGNRTDNDAESYAMTDATASKLMSFDNKNYDNEMSFYSQQKTLDKPQSNFKEGSEAIQYNHPLVTSNYTVENASPESKLNYFDGNEYPHMFQNGFDTHFDKVAIPEEHPLQVSSFDNRNYDETMFFYAKQQSGATSSSSSKDDLKVIEGIGPKIEELLNAKGIYTFAQLAAAKDEDTQDILKEAESRFQMHDATTWNEQAALARDGKWDELKKLQDELNGGRA